MADPMAFRAVPVNQAEHYINTAAKSGWRVISVIPYATQNIQNGTVVTHLGVTFEQGPMTVKAIEFASEAP